MSDYKSQWLVTAAKLPLAFAQVREDPRQDLSIVEQLPERARILMVASGGCTAAALACAPNVDHLHLVDVNAAQLALTRLKLRLLAVDPEERLKILGHATMDNQERKNKLRELLNYLGSDEKELGPLDAVAQWGPDYAGRYERLFVRLKQHLAPHRQAIVELLGLRELQRQQQLVAPNTDLGAAIDEAFHEVLSLENLVQLFGTEATNNPVEPFSRHFARRTRHVLATLPAATNPYLWQMLAGRFPPETVTPWLQMKLSDRRPSIAITNGTMQLALEAHRAEFDYMHLSNILDWLCPQNAERILQLAWQALRPGGRVMIRQLNSSLEIPALGQQFDWLIDEANRLHSSDRSFFYRKLHLGRKR
jgi:S-adenosylmethionine-diacylglycerol 3-amino-3-carboxypropyl transferase